MPRRRVISSTRYYMLWDCSSCGTKGINANTCQECPFCGSPHERRDANEREYRSSTPVGPNYKKRGADIVCSSCGSENRIADNCSNCGDRLRPENAKHVIHALKDFDPDWRTRQVLVDEHGEIPPSTTSHPDSTTQPTSTPSRHGWHEKSSAPQKPMPIPRQSRSRLPPISLGVAVVATILVIGGILYSKYASFSHTTVVAEKAHWSYTLPLEEYGPVEHDYTTESSLWQPPTDAYDISSRDVVVRTEDAYEDVYVSHTCTRTIDDSYTDTDGTWVSQTVAEDYDCSGYESRKTGERDIYGTEWEYTIDEWSPVAPLTASANDHAPRFPIFTPTETLRASGSAVEEYDITFRYETEGGSDTDNRGFNRTVWQEIEIGESYDAIIDGFGTVRAIRGIDPNYTELAEKAN
jgi:hypothetical protein